MPLGSNGMEAERRSGPGDACTKATTEVTHHRVSNNHLLVIYCSVMDFATLRFLIANIDMSLQYHYFECALNVIYLICGMSQGRKMRIHDNSEMNFVIVRWVFHKMVV